MFFNGINRLLLRRRRASPSSSVISITVPTELFAADSGKTFSLDSGMASIYLPTRGDISAGWTITVHCTVIGRYCVVQAGDVGEGWFQFVGGDADGVALDSLDAVATISFDGTYYIQDEPYPGVLTGYLD